MRFLAILLVLLSSQLGFAAAGGTGVLVGFGFLRYQQETEGTQIGNTKSTTTYTDWKVGYLTNSHIFIGGTYSTFQRDDGTGTENKRTLYGPTLGYHNAGWFLDGTYFFDGSWVQGTSIQYKKASGFGIDLGYKHMLNANIFVGISGSYKSFQFKQYVSGATTIDSENKVKSEYYPLLVLGVTF